VAREIGSAKEKTVGCLIWGGIYLAGGSFGLGLVFFLIGWGVGFAGAICGIGVGVVLMMTGLGFGYFSIANQRKGPRKSEPNFRILSRFCLDKNFVLLPSELDIEFAIKPKFYLRAMLQDGSIGEFETTVEVFFQAGEGMTGEAEIQGMWVGRFIPYIGMPTEG
jgi:hypothetical protein